IWGVRYLRADELTKRKTPVREWNRATAGLTGYPKEDAVGKSLTDIFIPEDERDSVQRLLERALQGRATVAHQVPLLDREGQGVTVLLNATARRDTLGNVVGVLAVGQDISELSKHQNRLEQIIERRTEQLLELLSSTETSLDRLDGILRTITDSLIVTDGGHRVVLLNPAAEALVGMSFAEAAGRPIETVLKERSICDRVKHTLEEGNREARYQVELQGANLASPKILSIRSSIMQYVESHRSGVVTIIRDVTQEHEVDRLKAEFLTTVAHEIRTPLTSIQGFSEILLKRTDLQVEERLKFLSHINREAEALASIVTDLLDMSRIDAGGASSISEVRCEAREVVRRGEGVFAEAARGHVLEVTVEDGDTVVLVDKQRIDQVFKNIVGNAVKYSPRGSTVCLTGKRDEACYRFSIQDRGMGMTRAQAKRVFDKFYKADASPSAPPGAGLGMTVAKYLIEAHAGKVWIETEYGKGTTVYFTLPVAGERSQPSDGVDGVFIGGNE
ncbi:PAS domain S-box protein, partial [Thermodesulfobacteriota bacterium]